MIIKNCDLTSPLWFNLFIQLIFLWSIFLFYNTPLPLHSINKYYIVFLKVQFLSSTKLATLLLNFSVWKSAEHLQLLWDVKGTEKTLCWKNEPSKCIWTYIGHEFPFVLQTDQWRQKKPKKNPKNLNQTKQATKTEPNQNKPQAKTKS